MKIWVDAQLSPSIARWMTSSLSVEAAPIRDLGLRNAEDATIFFQARSAGAIVMTKDQDFVNLVEQHGIPPQILWITCGNTSNFRLQEILSAIWPQALDLLKMRESVVEIQDALPSVP